MKSMNGTLTKTETSEKRDKTMGILTGIAIVLVVLGHLDMNELSVFGLFPYYSFHVMIFLFVSGYFYDPVHEEKIMSYIGHKALKLLLPYYVFNLIYGVISQILFMNGFSYCGELNLRNLFLEPFLGGHQFGLNFPSWFVPALFIIEVLNILGRKVISLLFAKVADERKKCLMTDMIIFVPVLAVGIATVYLAQGGHVWGLYKTPGRILFMLPVYEMGIIYRRYIKDAEVKIPNALCIGLICLIQFVLYVYAGGRLNFSAVWCTSFASIPVMPYLTVITGTWFWLRISRIIEDTAFGDMFDDIGTASFDIMMHHIAVFFLVNLVAYRICMTFAVDNAFDSAAFHSDVVYTYLPLGMYAWKYLYLIPGILLPMAASKLRRRQVR
ncbi:MAG: hypothetical protein K6G12_10375 [Lachnospiraceae bacterium]|nr:hypothetical protein [Lachnospiraceae bacterium]